MVTSQTAFMVTQARPRLMTSSDTDRGCNDKALPKGKRQLPQRCWLWLKIETSLFMVVYLQRFQDAPCCWRRSTMSIDKNKLHTCTKHIHDWMGLG
jgi:hypothetical protein